MSQDLSDVDNFEHRFRNIFRDAPFSAALLSGDDFIIEIANEKTLQLWGKDSSIVGKRFLEAMPEMKDQAVFHTLQDVYRTGTTFEGKEREAFLLHNGVLEKHFVNFTFKAIKDADQITGVLAVGYDVTDQVVYRQKLQESEERTKLAIETAGLGTFDLEYETNYQYSSKNFAAIFGFDEPRPFSEYLSRIHAADRHIRDKAHALALQSGKIFYEVRVTIPDQPVKCKWVRINGTILFNESMKPTRLLGTGLDISEEKNLQESEERFRMLITETPDVGVGLYVGDELRIQYVNDVMLRFWGKDNAIIGQTMADALPELKDQPFIGQMLDVFRTGTPFHGKEVKAVLNVGNIPTVGYFTYTYKALRNTQGEIFAIHHMAQDVSEQVKSKLKLIASEENVRRLFRQTPVGIGVFMGETLVIEMVNDTMLKYWGRPYSDVINKPLWEVLPEVKDQGINKISAEVYRTGIPYSSAETPVTILRNGNLETIYVYFAFEPRKDENGKIVGLLAIANEVTDMVIARMKIEKNETRLQQLADSMPQVVWIAEEDGSVIYYNRRVYQFANVKRDGDKWIWEGTVHEEDFEATHNTWLEAVKKVSVYEMEHRILMSDGSFRWHLSRAYPYKTEDGIRWYGTATDVHDQKVLEMNLERLVKERTLELEKSNEDLQQFAHVASHDLKEPIRKIKTFGHQLQEEYKHVLEERGNRYVNKIIQSTERMFSMINGVLNYASMPSVAKVYEPIDLNHIIHSIEIDLEIIIQDKKAQIIYKNLPVIRGLPGLIHQLFYNLINNSLKFSKTGVSPQIEIGWKNMTLEGKQFFEIMLTDNGIGFEEDFAEQIFITFFRLHSKDKYEGTGLGLAMCKKIIEEHGGFITAKGKKGVGAEFIILLPK